MVGITRPDHDLFTADDLEFLKTTAERVGVVFAATHLRRQEHAVSHRLQKALLPSALVENPHLEIAARYQPASSFMEVGGDWYDTFSWPSGHVGLIVGDVVGHDLESAAVMGLLRAGMAALAPNMEPSPAALLDALQQCARAPGGTDFVTAACAIVDTNTGKLTYSSAGHPPIFLVSSNGHIEVLDQALSPPLGALDITSRPETTITIPPGATLIMYTDGLVERRHAQLDAGIDRLRDALTTGHHLPIENFTDHLITTMITNSATEDDIVVICARFTPSPKII